jgi:hypothetical protein
MKYFLLVLLFSNQVCLTQAQLRKHFITHVFIEYTGTVRDPNKGNNPWCMGIGLNHTIQNRYFVKPVLEMSAALFLASDKVFRMFPDGSEINSIYSLVNFLGGPGFRISKNIQVQMVGGISLVNKTARWATEPSFSFLSNRQQWRLQLSSKTIYNRIRGFKENYQGLAISIGKRL